MTLPGGGGQGGNYNANVVLSADVSGYNQQMAAAVKTTDQTTGAINKLLTAVTRVKDAAKGKLVSYDRETVASLAAGTAAAALFEKQLENLRGTSAITGESMKGFKSAIENAFTHLPVARGDLVALANQLDQMGVKTPRDIGSMTMSFEKLASVVGGSASSLATSMLAFTNSMGDTSARNVSAMNDTLANLAKNAHVSAQGVADFASAIAPIAKTAGVTEKQVLQLSTAFNKAGADSTVAANTFNSILADITQLSAAGSPQVAKYANVLGLTVAQFNKLPRAQAVAELFQAINSQGSQGIATLNALGITGVRNISAVQSVVQGGGLNDILNNSAQGSQIGTVDKAFKESSKSLADSLAVSRNELTQYGTYIGTTFLTPMRVAVDTVNSLARALGFLKPALAVATSGVGLAGSIMGPALSFAAPLVLAQWMRRGPVGMGIRTGFGAGRRANNTEELGAYRDRMAARGIETDPEKMGSFQRMFYGAGAATGRNFQSAVYDEGGVNRFTPWRNAAIRAPFQLTRAVLGAQRQYYTNSMQATGYDTPTINRVMDTGQGIVRRTAAMVMHPQATVQSFRGAGQYTEEMNAQAKAAAGNLRVFSMGIQNSAKKFADNVISTSDQTRASTVLARETASTARAMLSLTSATLKASGSATLSAGWGAAKVGGRAVAGVGQAALGFMGGPIGMALMAGTVGWGAYSSYKSKSAAGADFSTDLNPIQKYNEQLGIASTNLAKFSDTINTINQSAPMPTTLAAAAQVTGTDVSSAPKKPTNSFWSAYAKNKPTTAGGVAMLQSMPITDPGQLQLAKEDMLASGLSQDQTSKILTQYMAGHSTNSGGVGQNIDYTGLAESVRRTEGKGSGLLSFTGGAFAMNASKQGKDLIANGLSGIGSSYQANSQQYNEKYAAQQQFAQAQSMFSALGSNYATGLQTDKGSAANKPMAKNIAHGLAQLTNGGFGAYDKYLETHSDAFISKDPKTRAKAFTDMLNSSKEGKKYLAGLSADGGTSDPAQLQGTLQKLMVGQGSDFNNLVSGLGPVGSFASSNATVMSASGTEQGSPKARTAAMNVLYDKAMKLSGNFGDASVSFQKLIDGINNADNPLSQIASAAQELAKRMQSYQLPTMSRQQQLGVAVSNLRDAFGASPDNQNYDANLKSAQDSYQGQKESYRQYMESMYQMAQQYGINRVRQDEDMNKQIAISQRDYQKQMLYQDQDYQLQVTHQHRDFNLQLQRQAEDAAKSMYNPFQRAQSQYTSDAASLLQNLDDQNQRMTRQMAQVNQLSKMGLSGDSIKQLSLTDSSNQEQVNNLVSSLAQNPGLIAKINSAIKTRMGAATALTENTFNETYQRTLHDFNQGLQDSATAYDTAKKRAQDSQATALSDLATNYGIMVKRSQQDLVTGLQEITGNFATMYGKTMDMVTKQLGKYAPQAAKIITDNMKSVKAEYPMLFDDNYQGSAKQSMVGGQGVSQGTAKNNATYSGGGTTYAGGGGTQRHIANAAGGIATHASVSSLAEAGPEAVIPLNSSGQRYMAGMYSGIANQLAQQMRTAGTGMYGNGGNSTYNIDGSTNFTGAITIKADDPNQIAKQLQQKARIAKLTRPTRSTAGQAA